MGEDMIGAPIIKTFETFAMIEEGFYAVNRKMTHGYPMDLLCGIEKWWQGKAMEYNRCSKSLIVRGLRSWKGKTKCKRQLHLLAGPSCTMEKTLTRRVMP